MFRSLIFGFLFIVVGAESAEYPLFVRVYDFTVTRDFGSVWFTDLEVKTLNHIPEGRTFAPSYLKSDGAAIHYPLDFDLPSSWNVRPQPSILSELQRRSLQKMLEDRYITKEMFDSVEKAANVWDPRQVRYAILWSPVPTAEALQLFGGKLPEDRLFRIKEKDAVGITRGGVLFATGQYWDEVKQEIVPIPLSWEKHPPFQGSAPLNRTVFPLAVEVSRLHAEREGPEPLQGDLREPIRVMLRILESEAKILNIPLERYAAFGWTLNGRLAAYDARYFGIRPFSRELSDFFERDFERALAFYPSLRLPRPIPQENLLFGSLAHVNRRFETETISYLEYRIHKISGGKISPEEARKIYYELVNSTFSYYLDPRYPEQKLPICVSNHSVFKQIFLTKRFQDLGVTDDKVGNDLMRFLSESTGVQEPNVFTHRTDTRGYLFPVEDDPRGDKKSPAVMIDNLSEAAALRHPDFLARAVLTPLLQMEAYFLQASPIEQQNLFTVVNDVYGESSPDYDTTISRLLNRSWVIVNTRSPVIKHRLEQLGGKARRAVFMKAATALGRSTQTGVQLEVDPFNFQEAYSVWFSSPDIQKMARELNLSRPMSCAEGVTKGLMIQLSSQL